MDGHRQANEVLLQAAIRLLIFVAPLALTVVAISLNQRSMDALVPLIVGAAIALTQFTLRPHPPMRNGPGTLRTVVAPQSTHRSLDRVVAMTVALVPLAVVTTIMLSASSKRLSAGLLDGLILGGGAWLHVVCMAWGILSLIAVLSRPSRSR